MQGFNIHIFTSHYHATYNYNPIKVDRAGGNGGREGNLIFYDVDEVINIVKLDAEKFFDTCFF